MPTRRNFMLFGAFGITSVLATQLRPGAKVKKASDSFKLDHLVPDQLGSWKASTSQAQAVNPQAQELLDTIYSQILERTYVNADGYAVMLAIAYGNDQRGSLEAHKPEVCYPAQGFKLSLQKDITVKTSFGEIPARYLETANGDRHEPVVYWFTMSNEIVYSKLDKRLNQLRQALTGQIPDGLLFRVSSIDADGPRALEMQERFVDDLLKTVTPAARKRLAGLDG